jgi:lysophospholipase L1-like esterase
MSNSPPFSDFNRSVLKINGLGDSIIGGQSLYTIYNATATQSQLSNNIPAWIASTAYTQNTVVKNGGYAYRCVTGGTSASSGGPSGVTSSITDNTVTWAYQPSLKVIKQGTSMLTWAEIFSLGSLNWDMSQGYGGYGLSLLKIIVISGGTGYSNSDTITLSNGATGTLVVSSGVITGVNITNIGYSSTNTFTYTINTSGGSGAVLSLVNGGTGTFGVPGCLTSDMVARLPDCLASSIDIFLINGGTNDATNGSVTVATTIANLQTCYETLMLAGKRVIASPITPRATLLTGTVSAYIHRVNRWIRAYCRGETWANPKGFNQIMIADPSGYMTDGTNGTYWPIGGTGGVANAVTQDGLHPSHRGAMYWGYSIVLALQKFFPSLIPYSSRPYSADDGFDSSLNPSGNIFEGVAWKSATPYVIGQQCFNGTSIYRCTANGTSNTSGGPLGSNASITDNTVTWSYMKTAKLSVFGSANSTLSSNVGNVAISGNIATGWALTRYGGTSNGSIVCSIENPWSNGQKGQRQNLVFSLGGGTTTEQWALYTSFSDTVTSMNIQSSELNNVQFEFESELEVSNMVNMTQLYLSGAGGDNNISCVCGSTLGGAGEELVPTSGDPLTWPNNGKIYLRVGPVTLPPNIVDFQTTLVMGFNANGVANSAGVTLKVNYVSARRYGVL